MIPALVLVEIFCMCTAAFFLFRRDGNPFAESASYAIISVFMGLSFLHQVSFITGYSIISTWGETFFFMVSLILIFRHRSCIFSIVDTLKSIGSANPISFIFLGGCFLYMIIHTFLPIPKEFQKDLYTISLYTKTGFFSLGKAAEFPGFVPVNHLVLFHTFLRFGSGAGTGVFSFLAYLSIGFSTYALARRYSWPPTAFTTAILVLSLPRLVIQALYPDCEIISVAVALFCLLAIYRTVELPTLMDSIFLILGLFFCLSDNISSMIFAPILFVLSGVVLFRRHGVLPWKSMLGKNYYAIFTIVPGAVFSQSWLFLSNHFNKGSWQGNMVTLPFNTHGIQGAVANFIRYIFESMNVTAPVAIFLERGLKWNIAQPLESLYNFLVRPFLGESGAAQIFHLTGMPKEISSFGPVGFFLVFPALFYAMLKGPRRLKSVAIVFFVYFYLVSLIMAWTPDNARFFLFFYVCAGFSIAFFLPPWRFMKRTKQIFQAIGCVLLLLSLLTAV